MSTRRGEFTQTEFYQSIGAFVVSFEHISVDLRLAIKRQVSDWDKNKYLFRLLLSSDMPLRVMIEKMKVYYSFVCQKDIKNFKILEKFLSTTIDLCEIRNMIVHGIWGLNSHHKRIFDDETEPPFILLMENASKSDVLHDIKVKAPSKKLIVSVSKIAIELGNIARQLSNSHSIAKFVESVGKEKIENVSKEVKAIKKELERYIKVEIVL